MRHWVFICNKKVKAEVNFYDEKTRLTMAEQSIAKKDPIYTLLLKAQRYENLIEKSTGLPLHCSIQVIVLHFLLKAPDGHFPPDRSVRRGLHYKIIARPFSIFR